MKIFPLKLPGKNASVPCRVDDEDYERLSSFGWYLSGFRGHYYAVAETYPRPKNGKRSFLKMSRLILGAPKGKVVDHINGDTLDNRKDNLRICTTGKNNCNRGMGKNNKSGFKGVSWYPSYGKWVAQIRLNGKSKTIGYYRTPEEAARAYDECAVKIHGKYARTNASMNLFPTNSPLKE